MNRKSKLTPEVRARLDKLSQLAKEAIAEAQEESRRMGVPNVYEFNGRVYYELPNGELSLEDPYVESEETS